MDILDIPFMVATFPKLLPGFGVTLAVSLVALVLAMLIGILLGTARALLPSRHPLSFVSDLYVGFVRGTPITVQIFTAYFLLPEVGIRLPVFWVGVIALTFNSAGYQIEIARAAIQSVPVGQYDGAAALGLPRSRVLRLVVLPQAYRLMTPALINEMSQLIKASSVLSMIAVFELHKAATSILTTSFKFLELLALQAFFYLGAVLVLTWCAGFIDRRLPGAPGFRVAATR